MWKYAQGTGNYTKLYCIFLKRTISEIKKTITNQLIAQ